jgi:hypothetical protein
MPGHRVKRDSRGESMLSDVVKVSVPVSESVSRYFRKPVPVTVSQIEKNPRIGICIAGIILKYRYQPCIAVYSI